MPGPRQGGRITLAKYLDSLEALYVVFAVRRYHHHVARAILKAPQVYFFDTGMVRGKGARFENACATMLLKHTHYLHDVQGRRVTLHDARDRSGRETDFVLREDGAPVVLAECKLNDASVARLLLALAELLPAAAVIQLVRELCKPEQRGRVAIEPAARWLAELAAQGLLHLTAPANAEALGDALRDLTPGLLSSYDVSTCRYVERGMTRRESGMELLVSKWGNSLAVRLPARTAKRIGVGEGDTLGVEISTDGRLILAPRGRSIERRDARVLRTFLARQKVTAPIVGEMRRGARY